MRYQDGTVAVGAVVRNAPDAVYVFQLNSAAKLRRRIKLTAHDGFDADDFGRDVGMTHDTLVIGAPGYNSRQGSAYVFKRSGDNWFERQKLLAIDGEPGDGFGTAAAIDRGMIIVGAPRVDDEESLVSGGAAYVFAAQNGVWSERSTLRPTSEQSLDFWNFGSRIAMFGSKVVVSANFGFARYVGQVIAYERSALNLVPTGYAVGYGPAFGGALSISGSILLVGSPRDGDNPTGGNVGEALIFSLRRPAN